MNNIILSFADSCVVDSLPLLLDGGGVTIAQSVA